MDVKTRVAIMSAALAMGSFVAEEVPLEAKEGFKTRVTMDEVKQVLAGLIEEGIIKEKKAEVGPPEYLYVAKPTDLLNKIDYAVLQ